LRNKVTNRAEGELGEAKSRKAGIKVKSMYIKGIIDYLIWPAFIIICWVIIKAGLTYYEKRFPAKDVEH